jgi:hypothetical protein
MTELAYDYLDLDGLFSADELEVRDRVRRFVQERIKPNIAGWYKAGHFPRELVKELGELCMHLTRLRLRRARRGRVRADCHGAGGRRFRTAHVRQRAGLAVDEARFTSSVTRSTSSAGCPGWPPVSWLAASG